MLNEDLIEKYQELSHRYGKMLNVTTHPIPNIEKSSKLYREVLDKVKNMPIQILIENLNHLNGEQRPHVKEVIEICENVNQIMMCWDIGHEIMDGGYGHELAGSLKDKIANIHIHDIEKGVDHYPFKQGMVDMKKSIIALHDIQYKGNIVVEIALDYVSGDTFNEKLASYMKQFEKFKK